MKINTIHFEKQPKGKLYVQVYDAIKEGILQGHMKYGDQLPSIRECATLLSLSRTTIEAAYQQLMLEGYIIAKAQRGYFIDVDKKSADLRKLIINQPMRHTDDSIAFDLRSSSIDAKDFDRAIWLYYLKEALVNETLMMSYGDSQGEYELRMALQKYTYAMRGVLCKEEQIVVGSSFQSLLYLICSLYTGNKVVGLEVGGFMQAEQVFHDCGFDIVLLAHDEEGITIEALQQVNIGMLYINSASCGSLRKSLRSKRRNAILQYAKQQQILIIEDDHNGELRYQSKMRPAMQGFDMGEQIIYIRSFSKLLLPSIRISFMVLTLELCNRYQQRKHTYNPSASKVEQWALAHYIKDGHLQRQVRKLNRHYERKSKYMMQAMNTYFFAYDWVLDESALSILVAFDNKEQVDQLIEKAKQVHILLLKTSSNFLVISFASIHVEEIDTCMNSIYQLM